MVDKKIAVSVKEGARRLGASESYIRSQIRKGNIVARKFGAKVLIPVEELEKYFNDLPVWTPGQAPLAANAKRRGK